MTKTIILAIAAAFVVGTILSTTVAYAQRDGGDNNPLTKAIDDLTTAIMNLDLSVTIPEDSITVQGVQGPEGDKGETGDQGPPGLTNTYVRTELASLGEFGGALNAFCFEEDVAIGGGFNTSFPGELPGLVSLNAPVKDLIGRLPASGDTIIGWKASIDAADGQNLDGHNLSVFVICVDKTP